MLLSLMPLLLVRPLIALGPVELDLELSIELDMSLRKTGLMIGRQALSGGISVNTNMLLRPVSGITHKR